LITTQGGGGANAINVRLGNGTGVFPLGAAYTVGAFPIAVVAGDFNGDAHLDLAVANNVSFGLTILIGDGTGAFSGPFHVSGASGLNATDLVAADLDGDGDLDLALALAGYGGVTTFTGDGAGGFVIGGGAGSNVLTECVAAGDLDGDGDVDIVSGTLYDGNVVVRLNSGAGTFGGGPTLFVGSFLRDVQVVDLDLDGHPDIVAVNQDGGF
ncbi:MAG: VCBS repeat-containing protein, partial [Myxococcales bacterium]|nr:VCBS repeat-containing protein [Myxococcales bacterium]